MKHSSTVPEIDDDNPHKAPPERALWCAVLATFDEDLRLGVAQVRAAKDVLQLACANAFLDSVINELMDPSVEEVCGMANVPYEDFVDKLLALVEGV